MTQTNGSVNVLVISRFEEDHERSYTALTEPEWSVRCARNPQEARTALRFTEVDIVVLADCDAAGGPSWYEIVGEIEDSLGFQPVIVSSRAADGRLWQEVLTRACHDLLPNVLCLKELLHGPTTPDRDRAVAAARRQPCGARARVQRRSQPPAGQRPVARAAASVASAV